MCIKHNQTIRSPTRYLQEEREIERENVSESAEKKRDSARESRDTEIGRFTNRYDNDAPFPTRILVKRSCLKSMCHS